jgi:hypothetical protein
MHSFLGNSTSDMFKILSVVGAYEYAGGGHQFCAKHFVRPKVCLPGSAHVHVLTSSIGNGGNTQAAGSNQQYRASQFSRYRYGFYPKALSSQ